MRLTNPLAARNGSSIGKGRLCRPTRYSCQAGICALARLSASLMPRPDNNPWWRSIAIGSHRHRDRSMSASSFGCRQRAALALLNDSTAAILASLAAGRSIPAGMQKCLTRPSRQSDVALLRGDCIKASTVCSARRWQCSLPGAVPCRSARAAFDRIDLGQLLTKLRAMKLYRVPGRPGSGRCEAHRMTAGLMRNSARFWRGCWRPG